MFSAIGLFFSGALNRLLKLLSAVFDWLVADWRHGPLAFLGLAFLVHVFIVQPNLRSDVAAMMSQRDNAVAEREATMTAYQQTVANYLAAAAKARRDAEANVARVEVEQAAITQETINDFQARLANARADAERLNAKRVRATAVRAAPINPGSASGADLPSPGDTARGVDEAPGDPRLPEGWSCLPGFVCLTIDEALIATEQAIQLDALIDWNMRQAAVPFVPQERDDAGQ